MTAKDKTNSAQFFNEAYPLCLTSIIRDLSTIVMSQNLLRPDDLPAQCLINAAGSTGQSGKNPYSSQRRSKRRSHIERQILIVGDCLAALQSVPHGPWIEPPFPYR